MSIACFKVRKWRATFIRQSKFWWMWLVQSVLKEQLWLVDSQCGIVGILLKFSHVNWCEKFQAWIWCEIFHTWNRCDFYIRHVQPCSTCEILNLHTFQTCFWCESGMKHAWSYENILYGLNGQYVNDSYVYVLLDRNAYWFVFDESRGRINSGFFLIKKGVNWERDTLSSHWHTCQLCVWNPLNHSY